MSSYRAERFTRDWPPRHVPLLLRLRLLLEPRVLWLLQHGRYALAQRMSERRGHDGVDGIAWHTTFEFVTHDGVIQRYQTSARVPDAYAAEEPILYDPGWPEHATLLRELPGAPVIAEDGTISVTS